MSTPPAVFRALVEKIPAGEDAAFIAQAGERGRITSRAGSIDMGSIALTAAAIDKLAATIFPAEQLRALQQTGLAQLDFVLPGIDGTFTVSAGSTPTDRWLDIRRRSTATPAGGSPVAEAAEPEAESGFSDGRSDGRSDLDDLAGLDFPPRGASANLTSLTVPDDIFSERRAGGILAESWDGGSLDADVVALTVPDDLFETPAGRGSTESWDEGRRGTGTSGITAAESAHDRPMFGHRRSSRGWLRIALPMGICLVAGLVTAGYFGLLRLPSATTTAASPPVPAVRTPPAPVQASAPPPASAAPQQQTSNAAPPPATLPGQTIPSSAPVAPVPPGQTTPSSAPIAQATAPVQAAPSSAPPAPAVPSGEPRRGFSVQVAAVDTQNEADRMVTQFVSQSYTAYVVRGEGAAANFYRVRIGPFPDRGSAEKVAKQLEGTQGIKPWIVKEIPENKTPASQMSLPEDRSNHR